MADREKKRGRQKYKNLSLLLCRESSINGIHSATATASKFQRL